jgi:uncharacterized protein (DUF1684 family)
MKWIQLTLFTALFQFSFGQVSYSDSLEIVRKTEEKIFITSVLDSIERTHFSHLCYFQPDEKLRVNAVFIPEKGRKFKMPMSNNARIVYYRKIGKVVFTIDSIHCQLSVYENLSLKGQKAYQNYAFLPFRDATSGNETYGGGRYLDVTLSKETTVVIDFNLSYHPYCAYSTRYSCPIVPDENKLYVPIRAGECYEPFTH